MIDDQKVVYEQILDYTASCISGNKKGVFIVKGGAGTGKSVLAIVFHLNTLNSVD